MNKLSSKKSGTVTIYIRPVIENRPWVRNLGGKRTTKQLLEGVRKTIAKRLKKFRKKVRYERYNDGWIFLCDDARVIWKVTLQGGFNRGWAAGERWTVEHEDVHTDNGPEE
jgi:hypothetical protein